MRALVGLLSLTACGAGARAAADAAAADAVPDVAAPQCDPAAGPTACYGNDIVACNDDGTFGGVVGVCDDGTVCANASCVSGCTAEGIDLIYVITEELQLLSFDPRKLPGDPFAVVGPLACPVTLPSLTTGSALPFSMAIDRDDRAWVEYSSGEVFEVSLADATCTASPYVPQAAGMALFGMGFASDSAGSVTEKLFISGGGKHPDPGGQLAYVDTEAASYTPVIVGPIYELSDVTAELTGTSAGRLYGFFPRTQTPAYVQELDKTSAAPLGTPHNLGLTGLGSQVTAWAFAQWGGKFYVFVTSDNNSTVRVIDPATGAYSIALEMLPYAIVGAGVSTCAPIQ